MVTIITGTTNKPIASEQLRSFFHDNKELSGYLYIGYPIIGTVNGAYPIDALWVSQEKGLVIFNLIEGKDISDDYAGAQDDCANKVESKLKGYKQLIQKRKLCVEINVVTFVPAVNRIPDFDEFYPLCNESTLADIIAGFSWGDSEYYEKLVSILQSISNIRKGKKKRGILNPKSRGAKLRELEDSIANLDNRQSRAVIETVEGVQRIRGLAGSGKTIVIALKAAYLHARHPEWKIAITFHTRSLKGQLRQLINTFYIEQTSEEPDWDNIHIIHAWGAPGGGERNGVYYTFCSVNNVEYSDYMSARNKYGISDPFGEVCNKALAETVSVKRIYDAILVDEAQDFSPSFLQLCYEMLSEPKRLVYAYDELQNLRSQSLPSPEIIFGKQPNGDPRVSFVAHEDGKPQQDIILEKCYRNSRPALVTAHALGFGIYRKPSDGKESGLVQMFEHNSLWNDIGYEVVDGRLVDGQHVKLKRTMQSSPEFLEKHSDIDDLIVFKAFDTQEQQDDWVVQQIKYNLEHDELRPDDIIVINPDPLTTKKLVAPIRSKLYEYRIGSHTAGVDNPDVFFANDNDSVAFTGIYRAKGNEAAMVYVINAQSCYDSGFEFDMARIRNQLFTAITRSKAWVRVVGVGEAMHGLISEYKKVKDHQFMLDFIYPTQSQRDHMNIVNRDMSEAEKDKVKKSKVNVASLLEELESGRVYIEDLGDEQINRLRAIFLQKRGE
ncbi:MAG: ATP-binding domain-containing protein [Chitinispirillales bacterium]|jgi:superfamily I DNA and RNA helicase|nr:ATP-binding domain-containing protein [Chitinispirillales bacterium]